MEVTTVIFDLDGTILNTIGDLANSCNFVLNKHGYPQHPLESYNNFVGNGISKLVERALPQEHRSPEYVEMIRIEFIEYYKAHIYEKTFPYPGISELLDQLSKRKINIGVASNKFQSGVDFLLKYYFADIHFVAAFGQSDTMPTKPNPAMVNKILEIAKSDRFSTLYIGDSNVDMRTAINAGLNPIGVTWGYRSREELIENGAWQIVNHPSEILSYV